MVVGTLDFGLCRRRLWLFGLRDGCNLEGHLVDRIGRPSRLLRSVRFQVLVAIHVK